jgi:hypothetical protein
MISVFADSAATVSLIGQYLKLLPLTAPAGLARQVFGQKSQQVGITL